MKLLVNLHAADLNDEQLYARDSPLSKIARRDVQDETERASLHNTNNVVSAVARLKELGFQIAIDDLGAGYAGLASFTQLEPEVAKLDMSLVRGIDADARRKSVVRSMKTLCDELEIAVVAEGGNTARGRDALTELGCDLLQGLSVREAHPRVPSPMLVTSSLVGRALGALRARGSRRLLRPCAAPEPSRARSLLAIESGPLQAEHRRPRPHRKGTRLHARRGDSQREGAARCPRPGRRGAYRACGHRTRHCGSSPSTAGPRSGWRRPRRSSTRLRYREETRARVRAFWEWIARHSSAS